MSGPPPVSADGPLVLFTDFGAAGPYIGQMKAALLREAPAVPVIDLLADAPTTDPMAAAYLLAALAPDFPAGSVFLAVVDPGVGTARAPVAMQAGGRWFVGPDNGLLAIAARRAASARWWDLDWRPERLSASFHGRDLFAPMAARLACGAPPPGPERADGAHVGRDWPDDLARVIYVDHFGNGMTGLRARDLPPRATLAVAGRHLAHARTFGDVPEGTAFWYENANGLVEIAVNRGRADDMLGLGVGAAVIPSQEGTP